MISIRRTVSSNYEERWARYTTPRRHIDRFSRRHHSARSPMRRRRQSLASRTRTFHQTPCSIASRGGIEYCLFERDILGVEIGGAAPWRLYTVGQILAHCPTPFDRRPHQDRSSPLTIEFINRSQAAATVLSTPQKSRRTDADVHQR